MAAIRSGLTPRCLARCFLRHTVKLNGGNNPLSDIWTHRLLQKSRLHTVVEGRSLSTRTLLGRRHHGKFLWVNAVAIRHNSSQVIPPEDGSMAAPAAFDVPASLASDSAHIISQPITEQVGDVAPTAVEVLQAVFTKPTLADLGLAGLTPVGLIQNFLEFLHEDLGVPWWAAIVVVTTVARLVVFPAIVKSRQEMAKLNNLMPEMAQVTSRLDDASQSGNRDDFAKAFYNLNMFHNKHNINPICAFLVPLVQTPVFITVSIALRKMAFLPVPSLQTGGLLWFPDLTIADPFYLLPLGVTGTMLLILMSTMGTESSGDTIFLRALTNTLRVMPFVTFILAINFPTAVITYWLTSNCLSLGQLALLRNPQARNKLKIPERIQHPARGKNEGFIEDLQKFRKSVKMLEELLVHNMITKDHLVLDAKDPLRPRHKTPPMAAASTKNMASGSKATPWKDTIG